MREGSYRVWPCWPKQFPTCQASQWHEWLWFLVSVRPLALCMQAAGILYYGIWMEKGAEETVQNCNFLDSKISDWTATVLDKTSNFQKRCESHFTIVAAMALWRYHNRLWNYHSSQKDEYVLLLFKTNMCNLFWLKIKAKNSTFLTASLPSPLTCRQILNICSSQISQYTKPVSTTMEPVNL